MILTDRRSVRQHVEGIWPAARIELRVNLPFPTLDRLIRLPIDDGDRVMDVFVRVRGQRVREDLEPVTLGRLLDREVPWLLGTAGGEYHETRRHQRCAHDRLPTTGSTPARDA